MLKYIKDNSCSPNIPAPGKTQLDKILINWTQQQRENYKKNILSHEQIIKLESIGFIFDILKYWFNLGLQKTKKFKEQNDGNPNCVGQNFIFEDYKLGQWQSDQRERYRQGKLSKERIKALESVGGFLWKIEFVEKNWNHG